MRLRLSLRNASVLLVAAGAAVALLAADTGAGKPVPDAPKAGGKTLLECLWARHSTRSFSTEPLPPGALDRILWCADGLNRADGAKRTAASAFECYPVSLYVVRKDGAFRYDPARRLLVPVVESADGAGDLRHRVTGAALNLGKAPVVFVLVWDSSRFPARAGTERRDIWAHAECGAIGQNVYLACADLGLGTVFAAVMNPEPVRELLGLTPDQEPAYLMPIGAASPAN